MKQDYKWESSRVRGGTIVDVSITILILTDLGKPKSPMSGTQLVEMAFQNLHNQPPKPCNMSYLVLIHDFNEILSIKWSTNRITRVWLRFLHIFFIGPMLQQQVLMKHLENLKNG